MDTTKKTRHRLALAFAIAMAYVAVACGSAGTGPTTSSLPPTSAPLTVAPTPSGPAAPVESAAAAVSAAPSPSPSPRVICPNPAGGTCLGPLLAGTYGTRTFQPRLSYVVSTGWGNYEDLPGNFELLPPGFDLAGGDAGTSDYIGVYAHVEAETAECAGSASDAGRSPDGIAKWLAGQRNLAVTARKKASIGGLDGVVLDIKLAKGFKPVVDWSAGRCVIIGQAPSGLEHGVDPGGSMRLYLLENPVIQGATLAIEIDDVTGSDALDAYSDVVKQFQFGG